MSIDLKHLGFPYFPITKVFSNSPSMFTENMAVIRSFVLFPPLHSVPFSLRVLSGKARKKISAFVHVVNVTSGVTRSDIW